MRRFFYSHSGIIRKSDLSLTTLTTLTNACDTSIIVKVVKVSKCQTACSTLKKVEWILSLTL